MSPRNSDMSLIRLTAPNRLELGLAASIAAIAISAVAWECRYASIQIGSLLTLLSSAMVLPVFRFLWITWPIAGSGLAVCDGKLQSIERGVVKAEQPLQNIHLELNRTDLPPLPGQPWLIARTKNGDEFGTASMYLSGIGLVGFVKESAVGGATWAAANFDQTLLRAVIRRAALRRLAWNTAYLFITIGLLVHLGNGLGAIHALAMFPFFVSAGGVLLALSDMAKCQRSLNAQELPSGFLAKVLDPGKRVRLEPGLWYRTSGHHEQVNFVRWTLVVFAGLNLFGAAASVKSEWSLSIALLAMGAGALALLCDHIRKCDARVRLTNNTLEVAFRRKVKQYPAPARKVSSSEIVGSFGTNTDVYGRWPRSYRLDTWYLEPDPERRGSQPDAVSERL